jgi:hypothetical protein
MQKNKETRKSMNNKACAKKRSMRNIVRKKLGKKLKIKLILLL